MNSDDFSRPALASADAPLLDLEEVSLRVADRDDTAPPSEENESGLKGPADGASARFTSLRTLWLNAAALLLVLLAVLAIMRPSQIAAPDEGLYLAQADALTEGSWSIPRQATDVDPSGFLHPLYPEAILGDRAVPYARHSAYPVLITPSYSIGGQVGTLVLSVLGTWGAAVSGAFVARRINPIYGLWALWFIGVGSPLLFDAYITMSHSLAAAAAGLAFLGATRALDDRRWSPVAYALPAVALAVMLRSEALVFSLGLGIAIGTMALPIPRRRATDWAAIGLATAVGFVALATYILDTRIDQAITGVDGYGVNAVSIATRSTADPIAGSWASLLRPFPDTWASAGVSVPIAALAIILGALTLRLVPSRKLLPLGFLVGAAAAGVGVFVNDPGLITGLIPAIPVLVAGLIWLRKPDFSSSLVVRSLLTSTLAAAAIVATIHRQGGATEWGGRLFHVLLPLLIPLMLLGLDNARRQLDRSETTVALTCLVVATLAMSFSMIRWQHTARDVYGEMVESAADYASATSSNSDPLVVIAKLYPDGSSRAFWDSADSADILTAHNLELIYPVLRAAKLSGRDQVVVMTDISGPMFGVTVSGALDELGWGVCDSATSSGGNFALITVGASTAETESRCPV